MALLLLLLLLLTFTIFFFSGAESGNPGINYGMVGQSLPSPSSVISLYKSRNVDRLRLFDPDPEALQALHGSGIDVVLGMLNEDIQSLAASRESAADWVAMNLAAHAAQVRFRYVTVGNEVVPGALAGFVVPAMRNLDAALREANLSVPVTTVVSTEVLGASYPPSNGSFSNSSASTMSSIISFLKSTNSPLLINVYPYFAYASNPNSISLDYALFASRDPIVQDGDLSYANLFDAITDAMYSAVEAAGGPGVRVVVSETGWPSNGGEFATMRNAQIYNNNLVRHVRSNAGTPKRPGTEIETYLFAIFNENGKPAGVEENFGLYWPDMSEVYHVEL